MSTIREKIRAMLGKTQANGATLEEELTAARKAREWMEKHQISLSDLELTAEGFEVGEGHEAKGDPAVNFLIMHVGRFCDCVVSVAPGTTRASFFGLSGDVIFAEWLLASLTAHVRRELAAFEAGVGEIKDSDSLLSYLLEGPKGFLATACARIGARLRDLKAEGAESGQGLVLRKDHLVRGEAEGRGLAIAEGYRGRGSMKFPAATAAGDRASFDRPIEGASRTMKGLPS